MAHDGIPSKDEQFYVATLVTLARPNTALSVLTGGRQAA